MIERASTCLKNGGKHLLRIPKNPFQTQRSIHSAFWAHGAGDINLPTWWHAFLQVPPASHSKWQSKGNAVNPQNVASDNTSHTLLDFLYPVQTLAIIRKYVSETSTTSRRHRRSQLLAQRSRTYTSAADKPVNDVAKQEEDTENTVVENALEIDFPVIETSHLTKGELAAKLHELLFADEHDANIRHIWQLYGKLQELSVSLGPGDLGQLFKRLSNSAGTFGAGKTRELFDTVALPERRGIHYSCTIIAALKQDDLRSAVAIHGEAADRINGSFGSSLVFKHAIQHADWEAALAVWEQYGDHRRLYPRESNIWDDTDDLPLSDLLEHGRGAVSFAINYIESSSFDDAMPARKLAFAIVQRALSVRNADFDPFLQAELVETAQSIQQPGLNLFQAAILQNFSIGGQGSAHEQWGLNLYRIARTKPDFVPDLHLLQALLKRCRDLPNAQELHYVLEDYRKHHIELPKKAYQLLMSQLARHGDFDTVEQLFRESTDRFGVKDISILAPHLLHACYRRAEVDRAIGVIETLQQEYGYQPDLRAWNTVFATYARVSDCDGALALLDRLVKVNVRPDNRTYGILMGMYAKRSDYGATQVLYEQAISEDVKPDLEMVGSMVLALATNDRLDEAEGMVEEALSMDFETPRRQSPSSTGHDSRTRMWNVLLGQYAMKGQLDKVFELQNRMREVGVAFDGHTYAALMQSLCIKRMPNAAQKILKMVLPQSGLRATALHYAIVMSGFLNVKDYSKIFGLQRRMVDDDGIKPTFSTQNTLLRTVSQIAERNYYQGLSGDLPFEASHAESILTETLENLDPAELAILGPTKFAQTSPPNVAYQTSYFAYMVSLYGRTRSFDKAAQMYDKYISTAKRSNLDVESGPPVEMLSALMVFYTKAGEHDEAEKCWQLAFEKSKEVACKANADTSQPGWVLHKYRFLLALPLIRYMSVLSATSRVENIGPLISSLQQAGYQLSTHNWNKYVQVLVQNNRALLAYQICEEKLMEGWPGWDRFGHFISLKRRIKKQWIPRSWEMGRPFPHYETFVYLASAYLDAQGKAYGVGKEVLSDMERLAPKTVETVLKMPRFDDKIQNLLLRRDD